MTKVAIMNQTSTRMPGYWQFLWMFFMQPLTLHQRLLDCGLDDPGMSAGEWWKQRHALGKNHTLYVMRLLFVLIMLLGLFAVGCKIINLTLMLHLPLFKIMLGLAVGVALAGVVGVAVDMAFGVVVGVMGGMAGGVVGALTGGLVSGLAIGVVGGVMGGFAFGVALGVVGGVVGGMAFGMAGGVLFDLAVGLALCLALGVAVGVAVGVPGGLASSLAFAVIFISTYLRLPIYLFETVLQYSLTNFTRPERTLRFAPIMWHDLSFLPHAGLARHIVNAAKLNPQLARSAIEAASRVPGQNHAAKAALAELIAQELTTLLNQQQFGQMVEPQGEWLPGKNNQSPLLQTLAEAARYMLAAQESVSPFIKLQHLNAAAQSLQSLDNQLLTSEEVLARFLPPIVQSWCAILAHSHEQALASSVNLLPNPFVIGTPLAPDMHWGPALFRGREDAISQIERLLADHDNNTSIALIGPRRCGKSTLLNMLRTKLPGTVVVVFDLQDHPCNTPLAFYHALAATAKEQAHRHYRLDLPDFPPGEPIEALKRWFALLEQLPTARRILLCMDEFERLEVLFPEQGREFRQLMGLLHATIQHCRRLRLLVAGAVPFDEMGAVWNDHFINLRQIRLGFFDEATSMNLLIKPVQEFPPDAIPPAIASAIYQRCKGQPFLSQVYGHTLVEVLNAEKRQQAVFHDIDLIEPGIFSACTYYFHGIWHDVPAAMQVTLCALAQGGTDAPGVEMDKASRKWLLRHLLIDENGQFLMPLFARWIRDEIA
jgi:hypothetical protein